MVHDEKSIEVARAMGTAFVAPGTGLDAKCLGCPNIDLARANMASDVVPGCIALEEAQRTLSNVTDTCTGASPDRGWHDADLLCLQQDLFNQASRVVH